MYNTVPEKEKELLLLNLVFWGVFIVFPLICHTFQHDLHTADTSVDVHASTSCCWKINFKDSIHLQGSILLVRGKQKQTAYPTVLPLPASIRSQHADHGMKS